MLAAPPAVLAHQGGWDEVGLVAAPLLVFAWLLWVANRRAGRLGVADEPAATGADARSVGASDEAGSADPDDR